MTLTLSFQSILNQIYARSAMMWLNRPATDKPAILSPDHEAALRLLAVGAFARLLAQILPIVKSTNLDTLQIKTDPFIILEIDATVEDGTGLAAAASLEQAVALTTLSSILANENSELRRESIDVAAEASRALEQLRSEALLARAVGLAIRPFWF